MFLFGSLTLSQTSLGFYVSVIEAISPFPKVFSTLLKNFQSFLSRSELSFAISFSLDDSKICCLGKG